MIEQLPATELAIRLSSAAPPVVVDVREPWEWEIGHIGGSRLMPLGTLPGGMAALDKDAPTVLVCHHGVRSQHAARFLEAEGFTRLANLAGGIEAWSLDVDPAIARY